MPKPDPKPEQQSVRTLSEALAAARVADDALKAIGRRFFFKFQIGEHFTVLVGALGAVALSDRVGVQLYPSCPLFFQGGSLKYFFHTGTGWAACLDIGGQVNTFFGELVIYR